MSYFGRAVILETIVYRDEDLSTEESSVLEGSPL